MSANNERVLDLVRRSRSLLRPLVETGLQTGPTPSDIASPFQIARLISLEARSEAVRTRDGALIVLDEAQARWLYALKLLRSPTGGKHGPLWVLYHYFMLRMVAYGLPNEARAFTARFRAELSHVRRDEGFDTSAQRAETRRSERFVLGHELGHLAYREARTENTALLATVRECATDLARLLRRILAGDRSLLSPEEDVAGQEDIAVSMRDYLDRFVFQETVDDIQKYERDLRARQDHLTLEARRRRYEVFAEIFDTIDFIEESFCDLYALEYRLLEAGASRFRAEAIGRECWQDLHGLFALTAMDGLARDRLVRAQVSEGVAQLVKGLSVDDVTPDPEAQRLNQATADLQGLRRSDRALIQYQLAMIKAVYRRVVFMNYARSHPLLSQVDNLKALEHEGEKLEEQLIGACASIRFNGIRMDFDNSSGYRDACESPERDTLDRLWADVAVRVPGMQDDAIAEPARYGTAEASEPRRACDFCGADVRTTRLVVFTGRASACDICIFVCEAAFAAMPDNTPRREVVGRVQLRAPPIVARPAPGQKHCRFCEAAPAAGEPLLAERNGIICQACVGPAATTVRRWAPSADPTWLLARRKQLEGIESLVAKASNEVVRMNMAHLAQSTRKEIEEEALRARIRPGQDIWCLFTEPSMDPCLPG